jgi:hypothetical protein
MVMNKLDKTSDAITDLYRASFYLAKESKDVGLSFLTKAKDVLGKELLLDIENLKKSGTLKDQSDYLFWAEKILDEYKRLKMNLSSD